MPAAVISRGHGRGARCAAAQARFRSHLGLLTAADAAHSRPAAALNAPVGSWAPAAGNGACLRARSAAVSSLRVFYAITALRDGTEKKEILGDMISGISNNRRTFHFSYLTEMKSLEAMLVLYMCM